MANIFKYLGIGGVILSLTSLPAQAQITPDASLNTIVTPSPNFTITGGTRSGNNLFHSFSQFSIPTNGAAIFNNATDIQNIFSRVTGSQRSNIDGILQTQGSANLFLMNPNGIIFGPNAQLQLGGSFLGTSASGIKFADGIEFNTVNTTPTLLSVNVPIGLQMGTSSGSIQVNGTGHSLASPSPTVTPYFPTAPIGGLKVQPGKTLALVGGPIDLVGGALTAERGRVELASLGSLETAALEASTALWKINTAATQRFSDIMLSERSIIDVSGAGAGSIQVQGQRVSLTDGSVIFVQNRGIAPAGDIQIKADALAITGGFALGNIRSSVISETLAGNSGNISVTARQINSIDGGSIFSRSFGIGSSGNIDINARESIKVVGFLKENPELSSAIGTVSFSPLVTGGSGTITVSTSTLSLEKGGLIAATTFGNAAAGNININADQIAVVGRNPRFFESAISSATLGNGNAGGINISTRSLLVKDQGTVNSGSSSNGDAGSININAIESINIGKQSGISSGVAPNALALIVALNLPRQPRGNAGNITINAPTVEVHDQGQIIVSNLGLGNSGKISLTSNQIRLSQTAEITAATVLGEGGNILLNSQSFLLRQGSKITATAGGSGNGGNITIDSPIILGLENSDIIANAAKGNGGNIKITTQGLIGLKYRSQLTPDSDITASSEFGINGNVQVNTVGVDPNSGLLELPVETVDPSQQIATGCNRDQGASFVITGRGGVPMNPIQGLNPDRPWQDPRNNTNLASNTRPETLIEATTWQLNPQGQPQLIAGQVIDAPKNITCAR